MLAGLQLTPTAPVDDSGGPSPGWRMAPSVIEQQPPRRSPDCSFRRLAAARAGQQAVAAGAGGREPRTMRLPTQMRDSRPRRHGPAFGEKRVCRGSSDHRFHDQPADFVEAPTPRRRPCSTTVPTSPIAQKHAPGTATGNDRSFIAGPPRSALALWRPNAPPRQRGANRRRASRRSWARSESVLPSPPHRPPRRRRDRKDEDQMCSILQRDVTGLAYARTTHLLGARPLRNQSQGLDR